jgi:hypothetical protein
MWKLWVRLASSDVVNGRLVRSQLGSRFGEEDNLSRPMPRVIKLVESSVSFSI